MKVTVCTHAYTYADTHTHTHTHDRSLYTATEAVDKRSYVRAMGIVQ